MADTHSIEVWELVRTFKDVKAVQGINLRVEPGEIYGFLGPNGAGKSTTIHMLTTLLPPTSGTAFVGGHDIVKEGPAVRRAIGAALQEAALDPYLTAREHLRLQGGLHGMRKEREERSLRAAHARRPDGRRRPQGADVLGRHEAATRPRARTRAPAPVLFLDEPTTGLDPQSRSALWTEVGRLAKDEGVTVFLTTQYLEEADVLADRVGIIDQGRIVAEGTPAALKAEIGRPTVEATPGDTQSSGASRRCSSVSASPCPPRPAESR